MLRPSSRPGPAVGRDELYVRAGPPLTRPAGTLSPPPGRGEERRRPIPTAWPRRQLVALAPHGERDGVRAAVSSSACQEATTQERSCRPRPARGEGWGEGDLDDSATTLEATPIFSPPVFSSVQRETGPASPLDWLAPFRRHRQLDIMIPGTAVTRGSIPPRSPWVAADAEYSRRAGHELRSMSTNPKQDTSVTLMMRVQEDPADPLAWDEFVRRYQPMIRAWCLKWGSQPSDADDVAQQVLLKLLTAMKQYRRQPGSGFRGWLKTVTHNAWLDFVTSRRISAPYPESINSFTDSSDAFDDLEKQMAARLRARAARAGHAPGRAAGEAEHLGGFSAHRDREFARSRGRQATQHGRFQRLRPQAPRAENARRGSDDAEGRSGLRPANSKGLGELHDSSDNQGHLGRQGGVGSPVVVEGWIRTRRDSKAGLSFLQVHDGSCFEPIQVVAEASLPNYQTEILHLTTHCSVRVEGTLTESQGKGPAVRGQGRSRRSGRLGREPGQLPGLVQAAHDGAPADGGPSAAADQHVRRGRAGARLPVDGRAPLLPRAWFCLGAHADHHHQRRRGGRRDVPRLDARLRQSPPRRARGHQFLGRLLRQTGQPHRLGPAQRRGLLPGAQSRVYVRAHVPRREFEHDPPPRRVLDDRARDRLRRS